MKKLICLKCKQVHSDKLDKKCPECKGSDLHEFKNSDEYLRNKITLVLEDRKRLGLQGLVGGLNCIVINTEADKQKATVEEFLKYNALEVMEAFEDSDFRTVVMKTEGSADFLIRSRKNNNPFLQLNQFPKSREVPNTRLESFVFKTTDIKQYVSIQKKEE